MAERVRQFDWSQTVLGPLESWPDTLHAMVAMLLAAQMPMQLFWGPEMITFYNDALMPAFAEKHPYALGSPGRIVWQEVWHDVGAQLEGVLTRGESFRFHSVPLKLLRNGVLEEMFWDYSYTPVFAPDGSIAGILNMAYDVTQQQQVLQDLVESRQATERSENQLRAIINALPAYLSYINTDYRYVWVNHTYERWFKRSASDMIGKTIDDVLGSEAAAIVRAQMSHAFAGEPRSFEYNIVIRDEERTLSVSYIPDFDEHGAVRGVIVQGEDITARKHSEKALLQSEKLAAVGRLAASIAHEINNPLESVTNLLYLAGHSREMGQIHEYLAIAERELRRVSVISSQTLRFYRQATRPRAVTSDDLFESVLSIYQGRLINSGIQLQQDRSTTMAVECFDGEIRQVLTNLVGNAIDAMHPDGGRLVLRSAVSTQVKTGRKGLRITVADTGCGMPQHVRERLFEAFYTTKGIGGTGLGLWVSREIVERHQGALQVRSSQRPEHHGTVFSVFLPFDAVAR